MTTSTDSLQIQQPSLRVRLLAELPSHQHMIIEAILPDTEISYQQLNDRVMSLASRPTQSQFDKTINELVSHGYLSSFIEDGHVFYLLDADLSPDKRDEQSLHGSGSRRLLDTLDALDSLEFDDPFA